MTKPKVSVIIHAYNARETVQETLGSVFCGDAPPHEILVMDDGSIGKTALIVKRYELDKLLEVNSYQRG